MYLLGRSNVKAVPSQFTKKKKSINEGIIFKYLYLGFFLLLCRYRYTIYMTKMKIILRNLPIRNNPFFCIR